jgi:hypothetical protein
VNDLINKNQLIAAADVCREAIAFSDGLASAGRFRTALNILEQRTGYQQQAAYRKNILKQEQDEKQELAQSLQSKDLAWWKQWIKSHVSPVTRHDKKNPEDTLKDSRLLAFLSLFCYMNANSAIAKQDEHAAVKIVAIYELSDPENPEPNYMRAILLARRAENDAAIAQLKISVSKGFADKQRLMQQKEFQSMKNLAGWNDVHKSFK